MNSFILLCTTCALHLALADGKSDGILVNDVMDMSDIEMREFLITRLSRQERRIDDLEDTVIKQNAVIESLQKALKEKESSSTNHAAQEKTAKVEHRVNKPGQTRRQVSSTPVAFSSVLTHDLDHLGAHQDIAFDRTYVNTNNVYNPNHGVFTVPRPGIYVISASVLANPDREIECEIAVNGAAKAYIYARGADSRFDQGTQIILLPLKQGDDVSVRNFDPDDSIYGSQYPYTSFSGFLLYEEESLGIVG